MKRQLALLEFALGSLRRRRGRSVALVAALAAVTGLYASGVFVVDALRAEVASTVEAAPSLTVQRLVAGRPSLIDEGALSSLASDPAVRSVRGRVWGFFYASAIEANIVVVGGLASSSEDAAPAVVGHGLSQRLALHEGDRLALGSPDGPVRVQIADVRPGVTALHDTDVLETTPEAARRLLGVPAGQVVDVAVELSREEEASVVAERAIELVPGARVIERSAMVRAYDLTFDGRGGLLNALLIPCLAALLLLGWERFTGLGPEERKEIAVLKSCGWHTSDVLTCRIYESLVIALGGALLGLLGAYAYVFVLEAPGLASVLLGWSSLHGGLHLAPQIDAASILSLLALVVLPFVAIGVVPAWRAAASGRTS
ncbi:MAG: FtsX-like permease family protein [Myxococcota bacterium]